MVSKLLCVIIILLCHLITIICEIPDLGIRHGFGHHLDPISKAQLFLKENPENYPVVECSIDGLIIYIQTRPDWAPLGQKRFLELVNERYYDHNALFRAIDNFIVQFGLSYSKDLREKWGKKELEIKDDPKIDIPFTRGIMSFAGIIYNLYPCTLL